MGNEDVDTRTQMMLLCFNILSFLPVGRDVYLQLAETLASTSTLEPIKKAMFIGVNLEICSSGTLVVK